MRNRSHFSLLFNDTATTEISTLSLHDALPSSPTPTATWSATCTSRTSWRPPTRPATSTSPRSGCVRWPRSEEHTSELQSRQYLVCRPLLRKKKCITNCHPTDERPTSNTCDLHP